MSAYDVIDAIKTAIGTITPTTYYVSEERVDKSLVSDTQLPAVIISTVETSFAQQTWRTVIETYEINLMILLKNDMLTAPLSALHSAQQEIITALFNSFILGAGSSIILKDSFELKTSSISNAVKQYEFGSAVTCILSLKCKMGQEY